VDPEQTSQGRARELVRWLAPKWPPTQHQVLWAIRIAIVFGVLLAIGYTYGITLWDWAQLLIVPAVIAGVGIWFNQRQQQRQLQTNREQHKRDSQIANQRAQDAAVQAYLDQMSQLLTDIDRPLKRSQPGDDLSALARARTLTVLPGLDGERKRRVLRFLYESGLIVKDRPILNLWRADLNWIVQVEAYLLGADLHGVHLSYAKLYGNNLRGSDLSGADLIHTHLHGADLSEADLSGAILHQAILRGADLSGADLSGAILGMGSGFPEFREEKPPQVEYLGGGAILRVGLPEDSPEEVEAAKEHLAEVKSLKGATMPNGQKYEEWLKTPDGQEWFNTYRKSHEGEWENRRPLYGGPFEEDPAYGFGEDPAYGGTLDE
jgi:uncharacterized protein YjbI with pentapeptide repeats